MASTPLECREPRQHAVCVRFSPRTFFVQNQTWASVFFAGMLCVSVSLPGPCFFPPRLWPRCSSPARICPAPGSGWLAFSCSFWSAALFGPLPFQRRRTRQALVTSSVRFQRVELPRSKGTFPASRLWRSVRGNSYSEL